MLRARVIYWTRVKSASGQPIVSPEADEKLRRSNWLTHTLGWATSSWVGTRLDKMSNVWFSAQIRMLSRPAESTSWC